MTSEEFHQRTAICFKKKKKNQIKIVNLKNTIARTDSLQHDEVRRLAKPLPTKQL